MYDYRRMTLAERHALVATRCSRGFPWHKPPHPEQGKGWYFISAATYEHRRHFTKPRELTALQRRLLEALATVEIACAGWVVLPNHYHLLLLASQLRDVGRALGGVHGRSARYVNERDGTPGRQVWYKYSDRKIRSDSHFWACLHYLVCNPVKHGYVRQMAEWPWSCYHEIVGMHGQAWLDDLFRRHPLGEFGEAWDPASL